MKNIPHHLAALSVVLWVGALWAVGYLAVPVLFGAQPDRQLAGMLAGEMFEQLGYAGIVCGGYLLLYRLAIEGKAAMRAPLFRVLATMLIISLAIQFGIQPHMAGLKAQALPLEVMDSDFAAQFRMWHGISSILYLLESLLGAWLAVKTVRTRP